MIEDLVRVDLVDKNSMTIYMANNLNTFSKISNVSRTLPKFSLTGLLDNASRTVNTINKVYKLFFAGQVAISQYRKQICNLCTNIRDLICRKHTSQHICQIKHFILFCFFSIHMDFNLFMAQIIS